jgi:hypothetical protein
MAKMIMRAQGLDGIMILMTDRVVIEHPGLWNMVKYGGQAKREIPLSAISEVIYKAPTVFTMGEIELVRGGRSSDEHLGKKKNKPNALRFARKKGSEFEAMKEKIFEIMNQQQQARR